MEGLSDPFDSVLLSFAQLQEQAQQPPQEQTPEELEREERIRERQHRMQEELDEALALREWEDRLQLVESLRTQIYAAYRRGLPDEDQYSPPSPVEPDPPAESESPNLDLFIEETWNSRTRPPLDMDTAETESDSENDSDLRLTRQARSPPSRRTHSPTEPPMFIRDLLDMDTAETESDSENDSDLRLTRQARAPSSRRTQPPTEPPMFIMDLSQADDSGSDGLSDGEPSPAPILGPTRWLTDNISEPELSEDEAEPSSDSSLGTIGTMIFDMEMDELAAVETNEEVVSENNSGSDNDSDLDIGMSMGRRRVLGPYDTPPREPIAIRARNFSPQEMAGLDMEVFLDDVRDFSIGFHLNVFSWLVTRRVRRMRGTALPGSFEHLLMHMFDDVRYVTAYQEDVRQVGIQRYMQARREGASHYDLLVDESPRADSSLEPGPSSQRPGRGISEDPSSTNAFFDQELRVLRLMVAPLRDRAVAFAWITGRTERPIEIREQFQASRELIVQFKRRLVRSLRQGETWTIHQPKSTSPFHEGWVRSLSLRQYRLDACGATLRWTVNRPDDVEPLDRLSGQQRDRLLLHGPAPEPLVHVTPDVQFSIAQGNEFENVADVQGYAAELLTLLVQIAQWLALARGHAAVHLFCDICRLFSLSGVDVSDSEQTAFCEHLLAMEVWADGSDRSDPLPTGNAAGSADSGLVGAAGHGNNQLGRVLMGVESLFHRVGDDHRGRSVRGVAGRRFYG